MTLPANVEQLNIGQLVAALSGASAQEFVTAVQLLKKSTAGVDWRILLGAITAENSSIVGDNAAPPNFSVFLSGFDRPNNVARFISVNQRGQLELAPPSAADGQVNFRIAATAAGGAIGAVDIIPAAATRFSYLMGLVWSVSAGAAAQPIISQQILDGAGPTTLSEMVLNCPANDTRIYTLVGPIRPAAANTAVRLAAGPAVAANTVQSVTAWGFTA